MEDNIRSILSLDIPSTNKLILIYFVLNGNGCVSQSVLAQSIGCSPSGLNKCLSQLQRYGKLSIDSKTYKQSYYKLTLENNMNVCNECGSSVNTGPDSDYVESTNGIFCDNKCFSKHVLMDDQYNELYPEG